MVWNLNKIINKFETISTNHIEINSFGYGDIADIDAQLESNKDSVQLWVQPISTQLNMRPNSLSVDRRFRLYCYDLIRQDLGNVESVWNATEVILFDVCKLFMYDGGSEYKVVNNPILYPFQEKFGDDVSGYFCEITVQTYDTPGTCAIPTI